MNQEELKKIIQEEVDLALKEAFMDQDIPAVATILKSIMMAEKKPRGALRRVSVYIKDGVLFLGEQIKKAQAVDVNSPEFKQLLNDKNISAVGDILISYLGMENMFVSDFVASLKQMSPEQQPKNTDDVSTVAPAMNQDTTKR
jgi:hypothetical protein